jgi:hypothetical protein
MAGQLADALTAELMTSTIHMILPVREMWGLDPQELWALYPA